MKQDKKTGINARIASFRVAIEGIITLFKEEINAKIHLFCTMLVIVFGILLHISPTEWIAIVFAIVLVIALELVNTALEELCDLVHPEKNNRVKKIKDMAAGAVLLAAIAAVLLACYIFLPKVSLFFS